jgi:hypothetical protein
MTREEQQPGLDGVMLACQAERWTGEPCGRVAPGTLVTIATTDGGTFHGIVCLRCRERLSHQGHEVRT